jgi:hypothetical protein
MCNSSQFGWLNLAALGFRVSAAKPGNSGVENPGLSGISGVSGLFPGVSGVHTATLIHKCSASPSFVNLSLPYPFTYPDGESEGRSWQ